MLNLMYITNSPIVAKTFENAGADTIFVDLEKNGKAERQAHVNSVKSNHCIDDIKNVKQVLNKAKLLVRINPFYENTPQEIEDVIRAGADIVMLPMWKTTAEADKFLQCVNGRTGTILLLETKEAVEIIDKIVALDNVDEIYIGLNDLHLSYKKKFMFELLTDGTVEYLADKLNAHNIQFGFGGIARLGEGLLPAERILMEHYRLGSSKVILSRSFCDSGGSATDIETVAFTEIAKIRSLETKLLQMNNDAFIDNSEIVKKLVNSIANKR